MVTEWGRARDDEQVICKRIHLCIVRTSILMRLSLVISLWIPWEMETCRVELNYTGLNKTNPDDRTVCLFIVYDTNCNETGLYKPFAFK